MSVQPPMIVVVDDETDVLRALRRLLRTEGFEVVIYTSGREFIRNVGSLAPDCIILDLHMPEMTGFDVLDELDALPAGAHPPTIVLTGNDTPEDRVRAMAHGAHAYLSKPADAAALLGAINGSL